MSSPWRSQKVWTQTDGAATTEKTHESDWSMMAENQENYLNFYDTNISGLPVSWAPPSPGTA